jgi:hypothetical protein
MPWIERLEVHGKQARKHRGLSLNAIFPGTATRAVAFSPEAGPLEEQGNSDRVLPEWEIRGGSADLGAYGALERGLTTRAGSTLECTPDPAGDTLCGC